MRRKILTAHAAMEILFGEAWLDSDFDPSEAQFVSGADVCESLAAHFGFTDEDYRKVHANPGLGQVWLDEFTTLAVWFTPDAIREHYADDEGEDADWVRAASDEELREVGLEAVGSDFLWKTFHEVLRDAVEAIR